MSSSDDDMPLARGNGQAIIPKSNLLPASVSARNRPVRGEPMDDPIPNGNAKRKSRSSINQQSYKEESDSDDGAPLAKRQRSKPKAAELDSDDEPIARKKGAKLPPAVSDRMDASDDEPLGNLARKKAKIEKGAKEAMAIRSKSAAKKTAVVDSDDEPMVKPIKRQANGTSSAKKSNGLKKEVDSDDEPIAKKSKAKGKADSTVKTKATPKKAAKAEAGSADSVKEKNSDDDEEEDEYRWWDAPKKEDNSIKWTNLEHNGVMFAPEYEPLPKSVRLYYDGKPLELHMEAEEVATFFGSMLHSTQNVENPVFQKNFFHDFKDVIKKTGGAKDRNGNKLEIKEFARLDFTKMHEHYQAISAAKKARSQAEKKAEKAEKEKIEAPYLYCKWDGRKEKVGNFRVEPPGLFRGRGEHPKTGTVKKRVLPEQVTINIGQNAKVPAPPPGHEWKAVQHDNKATWLAMWQENVNGNYKYVMLAANSAVKGQADHKKFEKARELKKHIARIRSDYMKDLKHESMADRQRATAMYLIDKLALRAGNEKDTENEAETVGCCSLKYEHVTLREPDVVIFDFLGKDSIRFYNEVTVHPQVFRNLRIFKKAPKSDGDDVFDRLNTSQLNKHLSSYMPGLTAKVFRTYNASYTMSHLLQELQVTNASMAEKIALYNKCNRDVAILCNHKRTVGAGHEAQMEKLGDRIKGLRYQKWRTKMMMLDIAKDQKKKLEKKHGSDFFEREADLTDEWIQQHQAFLVEEQRTKVTRKFEKENEKIVAEGGKPMPEKELKERLRAVSELEKKFNKENKSKKVEAEGKSPSVEKLLTNMDKLDERIKTLQLQSEDREGNKEVALGTSKINYIDPRLTVVFSAKFDVPIEKFFSKTLRDKFKWAIESVGNDSTWEF